MFDRLKRLIAPPTPESWELYLCQIMGETASVLVNTGIKAQLPAPAKVAGLVTVVKLAAQREDGLPTPEEGEKLMALDQALDAAAQGATSLGRVTWSGRCKFNHLVPRKRAEAVAQLIRDTASAQGYAAEVSIETETPLAFYHDALYPEPQDWQQIHDQKRIDALLAGGDMAQEPRPVEHSAHFDTAQAAAPFEAWALEQDYAVIASEAEGSRHQVRLFHVTSLFHGEVSHHSSALNLQVARMGGEYAGWHCDPVILPGAGVKLAERRKAQYGLN